MKDANSTKPDKAEQMCSQKNELNIWHAREQSLLFIYSFIPKCRTTKAHVESHSVFLAELRFLLFPFIRALD